MRTYNFFTDGKGKIICVTHYRGKAIRGVAKCSPNDNFNEEKGKEIAKLRCEYKLEKKRFNDFEKRYIKICNEKKRIQWQFEKICKNFTDSNVKCSCIEEELKEVLRDG